MNVQLTLYVAQMVNVLTPMEASNVFVILDSKSTEVESNVLTLMNAELIHAKVEIVQILKEDSKYIS